MASQNTSFMVLFLSLNLVFFSLVSGCPTCVKPKPPPKPKACPPPPKTPIHTPTTPSIPTPATPSKPTPSTPTPAAPSTPTPSTPTPATPATPPTGSEKCPIDTLKLGACANLLGGLLGTIIGTPPSQQCCGLIQGLADIDAALCLCTAIKANVLGINLNVPLSISLILSACQKELPEGFKCS